MRNDMNPTDRTDRETSEHSNTTEQTYDYGHDERYDDGLVHSHGWAATSNER